MRVPAVVGSWPEPFAQASARRRPAPGAGRMPGGGERLRRGRRALADGGRRREHRRGASRGDAALRVLVGPWDAVARRPRAALLERRPGDQRRLRRASSAVRRRISTAGARPARRAGRAARRRRAGRRGAATASGRRPGSSPAPTTTASRPPPPLLDADDAARPLRRRVGLDGERDLPLPARWTADEVAARLLAAARPARARERARRQRLPRRRSRSSPSPSRTRSCSPAPAPRSSSPGSRAGAGRGARRRGPLGGDARRSSSSPSTRSPRSAASTILVRGWRAAACSGQVDVSAEALAEGGDPGAADRGRALAPSPSTRPASIPTGCCGCCARWPAARR